MNNILIIAIGIGLVATGLSALIIFQVSDFLTKWNNPLQRIQSRRPTKIKSALKVQKTTTEDKAQIIAGFIGGLTAAGISIGTSAFTYISFFGMGIGVGCAKFYFRLKKETFINGKKRDVAFFFDAIELYIRSGMNIPQAMDCAKVMTPKIEKAVRKCVYRWMQNPVIALNDFGKDINLPEADILVSLLLKIHNSGINNMEGVIQREAHNVEKLRKIAAQNRINARPVYYMFFKFIPLTAFVGLFFVCLYYKMLDNFASSGIHLFGS